MVSYIMRHPHLDCRCSDRKQCAWLRLYIMSIGDTGDGSSDIESILDSDINIQLWWRPCQEVCARQYTAHVHAHDQQEQRHTHYTTQTYYNWQGVHLFFCFGFMLCADPKASVKATLDSFNLTTVVSNAFCKHPGAPLNSLQHYKCPLQWCSLVIGPGVRAQQYMPKALSDGAFELLASELYFDKVSARKSGCESWWHHLDTQLAVSIEVGFRRVGL